MRPPPFTLTLAALVANGVFLIVQLAWLLLFSLFVSTARPVDTPVVFVMMVLSMAFAAPFAAYFGTRVLINFKRLHATRPPWRLLILCTLSVPLCAFVCRVDGHASRVVGRQFLAPAARPCVDCHHCDVHAARGCGRRLRGFRLATRFAPLQTLRVNPIARPHPPLNVRFTVLSMMVPVQLPTPHCVRRCCFGWVVALGRVRGCAFAARCHYVDWVSVLCVRSAACGILVPPAGNMEVELVCVWQRCGVSLCTRLWVAAFLRTHSTLPTAIGHCWLCTYCCSV